MKILTIRLRHVLVLASLFLFAFAFVGCTEQTTSQAVMYTVSFDTNGGNEISSIQVENGRRITGDIPTPVKEDESQFVGWYTDDDTFLVPWNFTTDIVTADVTLHAKWILAQTFPTETSLTDEEFSNSLEWIQTSVVDGSSLSLTFSLGTLATRIETVVDEDGAYVDVEVEYYTYEGTPFSVSGTLTVTDYTHVVWSPNESIPGGVYQVTISTEGEDDVVLSDLYFKGEGTLENPYLLTESADLYAISTHDEAGLNKYYKVDKDFASEVAYEEILDCVFSGDLNGNNHTITVTGNAGMFYELSENAYIYDLTVSGVITTASTPTVGALAIINHGEITNITSRAAITSSAGMVGDMSTMNDGGAGGLVGVNEDDGIISNCTFIGSSSSDGVIKAYIGGGGIASINYGLITDCDNRGTLGAYNSVESGKSMSNYSYMGGIAGFNFGTITRSQTTSTGKLLGQRYFNNGEPTDTSNNRVIGGIVGYNAASGVVSESFFSGIRVHGDQYVGGIAGINAGLIENCYTLGRYYTSTLGRSYIAGRLNVGGIAGALEGDGIVRNCFNAANVYAFDDQPYAIAEYATNSVYLQVNLDLRSVGDQLYGNCSTDNPLAPIGSGNVMVSNTSLVQGDGVYYVLPGSYASILGDKFVSSNEETLLAWQIVQ